MLVTCTRCCCTRTPRVAATITPDALTARRIGTGVHYRGVHLHPFYRDKYQPAAPRTSRSPPRSRIAPSSLPLSPKVTDADQDDVVEALIEVLRR